MVNMTTVLVPTQHPAFDGHFPGAPLLPGVVLLDEVLRIVAMEGPESTPEGPRSGWRISTAKFLQPVRPGDTLTFEHESLANGAIRFAIRSGDRVMATGTLVPRLEATKARDGHQAG